MRSRAGNDFVGRSFMRWKSCKILWDLNFDGYEQGFVTVGDNCTVRSVVLFNF